MISANGFVSGYIIICWLAIVDTIALIGNVFELIITSEFVNSDKIPGVICTIHVLGFYITLSASLNLVLILSADRFCATFIPYKQKEYATISNANISSFVAVVLAVISASPFTGLHAKDDYKVCFGVADYVEARVALIAILVHRVVLVFTPGLLMVVLNASVIIRLTRQSRKKRLSCVFFNFLKGAF